MAVSLFSATMSEQIKVIAVTNRKLCDTDFCLRIKELCLENTYRIILREKDLSENEYGNLFKKLMEICCKYKTELIGNKFESMVKEIGGKGFQYSYANFMEKDKRHFDIEGVSVHSVEEAINAKHKGADYLIAGHIFVTDCKKGVEPRGLDFLKSVCSAVDIPVFAIGGINDKNAESCIKVGAKGVCKMSGAMKSK